MYDIGLAVFKASVIGAPPKCEVCGAPSTLISKGRCLTCNLLLGRLGDDPDRFAKRAVANGEPAYARAADYLRAPPAEALGETFFTRRIRFLVRRMDPQLAAMLANFP